VKNRILSFAACGAFVLAGCGNSFASTIALNFDSVDATAGVVDATAYFASYGITLSNVTAGTAVDIIRYQDVYGGGALTPVSAPNLLMQLGSNDPVSFELDFSTPLTSFGFTIPSDSIAPGGDLFPPWQARAYNGATLLSGASDTFAVFHGPLSYTLNGPDITSVVIATQNGGVAGFSGIPLDNMVLGAPDPAPVPEPASFLLLGTGLLTGVRRWRKQRMTN
jgi:hypothetical protein